jgi:hypothetical protein
VRWYSKTYLYLWSVGPGDVGMLELRVLVIVVLEFRLRITMSNSSCLEYRKLERAQR